MPLASVTVNFDEVPTTCAFVTMWPFLSKTTPEPRPLGVSIWTTDGATFLTTETSWFCSAPTPAGGALAAAADGTRASAAIRMASVFTVCTPRFLVVSP